jgi:hypothetical protein
MYIFPLISNKVIIENIEMMQRIKEEEENTEVHATMNQSMEGERRVANLIFAEPLFEKRESAMQNLGIETDFMMNEINGIKR